MAGVSSFKLSFNSARSGAQRRRRRSALKLLLDLPVIPPGGGPDSLVAVLPNDDKRFGIIWPIVISPATGIPQSWYLVIRTEWTGQ